MDKLMKSASKRNDGGGATSNPQRSSARRRAVPDGRAAPAIPLTRADRTLLRALVLTVTELEPGADCRYVVEGGHEPQRVSQEDGEFTCTCMAFFSSRQPCKHIIACLLERGHLATRQALQTVMRRVLADYRLALRKVTR